LGQGKNKHVVLPIEIIDTPRQQIFIIVEVVKHILEIEFAATDIERDFVINGQAMGPFGPDITDAHAIPKAQQVIVDDLGATPIIANARPPLVVEGSDNLPGLLLVNIKFEIRLPGS